MTGFLSWTLGSSFLKASGSDFQSILGSSSPPPIRWSGDLLGCFLPPVTGPCVVTAISVQSFCERPERERGEVGKADEHEDHADEHADEQRLVRFHRADAGR